MVILKLLVLLVCTVCPINAIELNINDSKSIKKAAGVVARDLMKYYSGNQPGNVLGKFPFPPYYWWQSGAAWGAMIDYWYLTGDSQYNEIVTEGLLAQVGEYNDYMPVNETANLGNDDQAFWAIATIGAAERNFPDPPKNKPQWLPLTQAVFNTQARRWDMNTCNGGLRWQVFTFNNGYNYKNSISNGCFFQLATRLAKYTGNTTYIDWADKVWNWTYGTGLLKLPEYYVYDGADVEHNCTNTNHIQWTYNAANYIIGAAYLYNITESDRWKTRLDGLMKGVDIFFMSNGVMYEAACEPSRGCNVDQRSFRGYLARFMSYAAQVAPHIYPQVRKYIEVSSVAAAKSCSGGETGTQCGMTWGLSRFDGDLSLGNEMSALEIIQSLLTPESKAPVTADTGGTSPDDPTAGTTTRYTPNLPELSPVTTGDRVGAAFTTLGLLGIVGAIGIFVVC